MIKLLFVIIGTIIGAGFASGKEIEIFFYQYGKNGIYGMILTSIFFGYLIYKIIKIIKKNKIENYEDFLNKLCKNKKINNIIIKIINIFLLISFLAMVAGFSNYCFQEWNIPILIGNIIFVVICYITLSKKANGIVKINTVLVPFLVMYIVYLGIENYDGVRNVESLETIKTGWIRSAILYVSYNTIVLVPIIISLKKLYENKSEKRIGLWTTISFIFIMFSLFLILLKGTGNIVSQKELPIIFILAQKGMAYKIIYGVLVVIAIFTSAISAGYGFLINVSKNDKRYNALLITICIVAVCLSKVSFSYFIEVMYPFFGILGLSQIVLIK